MRQFGQSGVHVWDGDEGVHVWGDGDGFHLWAGDDEDDAYLGIHIADSDRGARVVGVEADSPAAGAGIEVEDVVIAFEGEEVDDSAELVDLVRGSSPAEKVALKLLRSGIERRVEATLASLADRHR